MVHSASCVECEKQALRPDVSAHNKSDTNAEDDNKAGTDADQDYDMGKEHKNDSVEVEERKLYVIDTRINDDQYKSDVPRVPKFRYIGETGHALRERECRNMLTMLIA